MSITMSPSSVLVAASVAALAILTYMVPSPIDPKPYSFPAGPPELKGVLSVNRHLQKVHKLHEGHLIGPESFTGDGKETVYTGTTDGQIWQIKNGQARVLNRTGISHNDCGSYQLEPRCGRPKGMGLHPSGALYLLDSYKGLFRMNVTTGEMVTIVTDPSHVKPGFLNGLTIGQSGNIFFTVSSTKWERRNFRYEVLETNSLGRVIHFDPETGTTRVLMDGLYLANGIALSQDESFLVISETSVCRIQKLYLRGRKAGEMEIFQDNLPGYPDNIRLTSWGTFYVGLTSARFEGSSPFGSFLDHVAPYPAIKRIVAKITPFAAYNVFLPRHAILLELDAVGNIIHSFHDPDGLTIRTGLSEAFEQNGFIYMGSFSAPYVGYIKTEDLYQDSK